MTKKLFKQQMETHFDNRKLKCFKNRWKSPLSIFNQVIKAVPDRDALVDENSRITYHGLDGLSTRFASALLSSGLKQGDRVAINTTNRVEFVVTIYACLKAGLISVPVGHSLKREELIDIYNDAGVSAVFFDNDTAAEQPTKKDVPSIIQRISIGSKVEDATEYFRFILAPAKPLPPLDQDEEHCVTLLYTSGTTGKPKGAMLTNMNIVHSVMHMVKDLALQDNESTIVAIPFSHVTGLLAQLYLMLACAGKLVLAKKFEPQAFVETVEREGITFSAMLPMMYRMLLQTGVLKKNKLKTWRVALYGGAAMHEKVKKDLASALPKLSLHNTYGATETTSVISLEPSGAKHPANSVGQAVACAKIKIVDDKGKLVKAGEIGEFWIKGPMVIPGYWNDEKATKAAFKDGFWKSGDLGFCDDKEYYHIVDRKEDVITRGDKKIYCIKIEDLLLSIDGVLEAVIVPDVCKDLGQKSHAHIYTGKNKVTKKQIIDFMKNKVSDYQIPDEITFSKTPLPRSANGKKIKNLLRA